MILEVYDLECLSNLFTYTGYCPKEDKYYQFVICNWRNEIKELYNHLNRGNIIQVGFNNISYDYPLEHHFLNHYCEYKNLSGTLIAQKLYKKSQEIIEQEFSAIADKNQKIQQIDLYRIWHYNNPARASNLKDLEVAMRMENIEEMPIHHSTWCKEGDEEYILSYNKNDVYATYLFLKTTIGKTDYPLYKGKDKIKLRQDLNKKFNVNVLNMGDVPMGAELMLHLYAREANKNPYELKRCGGTPRPNGINLKDCIPYWCNIKSKEFKSFLDKIKNTTIRGIKGEFAYSVNFHGYIIDFGQGGAHGCCKSGIYNSNDNWMILDLDVSSLYPSVAKSLKLYPEHLGPEFMEMYEQFIEKRIAEKHKPKEERDNVLIEGYKLVLNGVYGKSNESSSFVYDPLYTFRTTIAGQLFICMWTERMYEAVPDIKFLQTNTDGITVMIPKDKLEIIRKINNQLTEETTLGIEEAFYSKMVIRDVNNYLAVYTDSTKEKEHIKLKGDLEIDKEYHKDPSMRIVPLALKEYFVYDIPLENTICNHTDIFDFCLRLKTKSNSSAYFVHFDYENYKLVEDKLDRTTRYYMSNQKGSGGLVKKFADGKETGVNVGNSCVLFNKYEKKDIKDYKIDYMFYIKEANKIKDSIVDLQLTLF